MSGTSIIAKFSMSLRRGLLACRLLFYELRCSIKSSLESVYNSMQQRGDSINKSGESLHL